MAAKIITARDCQPFYKGYKKGLANAIWYKEGTSKIPDEVKILTKFLSSIVPVSIYADDSKYADADSKLAYSPYETQPYPFEKEDDSFSYQRVWQAGRYIGTTQIDGCTVNIEPRFGNGWLEYLLADVFHFRLTKSENERDRNSWNELMRRIFWHLWVNKFSVANQYGLPRRTAKRIHQGIQIRGRLNARKSIFPFFMKHQVVSEYWEKEVDDAICRIVYKAYSILAQRDMKKSAVPSQIQESLNDLYSLYQGHPISVSPHDYHGISYKSIYLSWKPLVDFSWQIIQQDSLCKHKNVKGESFSLFLDMAEIWEAFLRKKLGDGFANDGWRVLSIEECTFQIYRGKFYQRDIIPDIILEREQNGQKEYMVFDAKYKRMRANKEAKSYDVDRTDLFQIHTYIQYVEHHLGHVIVGGLLYPLTKTAQDEEGNEVEIVIDENRFHSEHLFGWEERNNANDTIFIIDGVYCPESNNDDEETIKNEMERYVEEMINRIKKYVPSPN